jgi:hypothetical protein
MLPMICIVFFLSLILLDSNTGELLGHRSAAALYVQHSCRLLHHRGQPSHSSSEALIEPSRHVLFLIGLRRA